MEAVKEAIEKAPDAEVIVQQLEVGGNTKAVLAAVQHVKSVDKAAYFFSIDEVAGRVGHQCFVPKVRDLLLLPFSLYVYTDSMVCARR